MKVKQPLKSSGSRLRERMCEESRVGRRQLEHLPVTLAVLLGPLPLLADIVHLQSSLLKKSHVTID